MTLKIFIYLAGILLAWTAVLGFCFGIHTEQEVDSAYKQGAVDGASLVKEVVKEDSSIVALKWWVGSNDMSVVKKKLCR